MKVGDRHASRARHVGTLFMDGEKALNEPLVHMTDIFHVGLPNPL